MIKHLLQRAIDQFGRERKCDAGYGLLAAAALVVGLGLAAPAAAHAAVQPAGASPYTMTPRRIGASLSVVVALIGAVLGGRALARGGGRVGTSRWRGGGCVVVVQVAYGL